MTRLPAKFATPQRAYAAGLRAQLLGQTPYQAWRTEQALTAAPPEISAALAAGMSSDLAMPMPGEAALLAAVVSRLAETCGDLGRARAGAESGTASVQASV